MSRKFTSDGPSKEKEEFLRRKRFHAKNSSPGQRIRSESGAEGGTFTLPPGLGPKSSYSRTTTVLTQHSPEGSGRKGWNRKQFEDDFETFEESPPLQRRQVKAERVVEGVVIPEMRSDFEMFEESPPLQRPKQVKTQRVVEDVVKPRMKSYFKAFEEPPPLQRPRQVKVQRVVEGVVKPKMRSVFVNVQPQTATAQVQTQPIEPEKPDVSAEEEEKRQREMSNIVNTLVPLTGSVQHQADTLEETRRSIRKLTSAHKDLMQQVAAGGSLSAEGQAELLTSMNEVTDRLDMLTSVQTARTQEEDELNDRIMEVKDAIENRTVPVESFIQFTDDTERHLSEVTKELKDLRRKHEKLSRTMEESTEQQKKLLKQEKSIHNVVTLVKEIHEYNMGKKAEEEKVEEIKKKDVVPNDSRGKMFLHSNSLPLDDPTIVKQVAIVLADIEEDSDDLEKNLEIFRTKAQEKWTSGTQVKTALTGLFKMALFTNSGNSSLLLANAIGAADSSDGIQTEQTEKSAQKNMAEFVKGAINFQNAGMVKDLLKQMEADKRKEVVNTVVKGKYGEADSYLLFVSARSFDLDMFEYIVSCGADLDVKEGKRKRTILHLFSELSTDETRGEGVLAMIDVLYKQAGTWWEHRVSKEGSQRPVSDASHLAAVRYLFDLKDAAGLEPLGFAAKVATPDLVKKIITNQPYHTLTDPVSFDCDSKKKVYFMDDLDVRFAGRLASVLESIVERKKNALEICEMEPFCQILSDKWDRYRVFYWLWFLLYLLYISTYSACAVGRHVNTKTFAESYSSTGDKFRGGAEIACILTLPCFFYGDYSDFNRMTFSWTWLIKDQVRIGNFAFVVFVILTMIFRIILSDLEDIFLCFSLILGWMLTTRFLVATPLMGVFPGVIFKVFKEDILKRFIWIFLIILIGMTTATFCAYQRDYVAEIPNDSFFGALYSIIKLTFGMLETDYVTSGRNQFIGVILFLLYLWLGPILLVNMLIAMVNDTYSQTRHQMEREWMLTKASFALIMERRLPMSVWIPYNNDKDDQRPTSMWKYMYKFNLYSRTRLRYGHKLRPRRSLEEPEEREHFVIMK